jgi:hypothetical protein
MTDRQDQLPGAEPTRVGEGEHRQICIEAGRVDHRARIRVEELLVLHVILPRRGVRARRENGAGAAARLVGSGV